MSNTVKILIVDDQRLIREGIASLLSIQPGIEVVGTADGGVKAIQLSAELQPDLILMDIRMPTMDGIETTQKILAAQPDVRVLMLTTFDDEDYIIRALRAGAYGYLLKNLPATDLARAIKLANQGVFQLDPGVAGKLIGNFNTIQDQKKGVSSAEFPLTNREREVLKCLAAGDTNREIAAKLVISMGTVKSHVSSILNRLDLRDRVQAAIFARENGLA